MQQLTKRSLWVMTGLIGLFLLNPLLAVTITLTDNDPCAVMGALIDQDGDGYASLAVGQNG